MEDWRLNGQEEYLTGVKLIYMEFTRNGENSKHEHCVFCWHTFMCDCANVDDCSTEGYCTFDKTTWICEDCYNEFKEKFCWRLFKDRYAD